MSFIGRDNFMQKLLVFFNNLRLYKKISYQKLYDYEIPFTTI